MIRTAFLEPYSMSDWPANATPAQDFAWKLWLYTNFDCNLRCSYCVARSSPAAPRRALGLEDANRLVDEAVELGFSDVFFTGGEPFILNDIYEMLRYASERVRTTVLTNGMLLRGRRLERLAGIAGPNLLVQVSLDGARPEDHDPYRGDGSWVKTVEGIRLLQERGLHIRLSTTITPVNTGRLEAICEFHRSLGIPEEDHFMRPLAKRGFSSEGLELSLTNLAPEITATIDGIFWHPLSTDADMQISRSLFPLADAVQCVQEQLEAISRTGQATLTRFT
jgi:MoaA/NifB/PqqE/SkfB family radical SAM enzyme